MHVTLDPDTVTNVTGTAFVVAEYRAEENYAVTPLYRDDVVGLFLSAASRRAAAQAAAGFPLVKELVKIRTRYFDDMLERQIDAGVGVGGSGRRPRAAAPRNRVIPAADAGRPVRGRPCHRGQRLAAGAGSVCARARRPG